VGQEAAEAAVGAAGVVVLVGGFGLGGRGAAGGGDGVAAGGRVLSVKVSGAQARRRCQTR
jgi:hypothetical protein